MSNFIKDEFGEYMEYARKLTFEANPQYAKLRFLFENIIVTYKIEFDLNWDWNQTEENIDEVKINF